jgi:AcrR family transcriptional regulator
VARRAGVTVQTVIRRFGGKQGLLAAAAQREAERVRRQRDQAPVGDLPGAVRNLLDHHEELGVPVLRLLAQEDRSPALRALADQGRAYHAGWCERVFAPTLTGLRGAERARRLAQLVAVTDVLTWEAAAPRPAPEPTPDRAGPDRTVATVDGRRLMARILAYTTPGRGHLFPLIPILEELRRHGHQVVLRTLAAEVAAMRAHGFDVGPISDRVEAIAHDDWRARSPRAALARAVRVFAQRAEHDAADLRQAIGRTRCWSTSTPGAQRPPPRRGQARGRCSVPTRCRCAQWTCRRSVPGCPAGPRPAGAAAGPAAAAGRVRDAGAHHGPAAQPRPRPAGAGASRRRRRHLRPCAAAALSDRRAL